MKHNRKTTIFGLVILIGLFFSSMQSLAAASVEYNIKTGDFYYYECTYAYYPVVSVKVQNKDPVNTTLIRLDIVEATVGTNAEMTSAWGNYYADIFYMNKGDNWEQVIDNSLYTLDSSIIETFGLVAFTDAAVSKAKITDFFVNSPILIPNPAGLSDSQWNQLKQELEGNIFYSYGSSVTASFDKAARKFTIQNIGTDPDKYTLVLAYNEQGDLELYDLYSTISYGGQNNIHTIFRAELQKDSVNFPDNLDEFPWQAYLIAGLVVAAVVIGIIIWRKKR